MGYSPWGHKELDMTEQLTLSLFLPPKIKLLIRILFFFLAMPHGL